MLLQVHRRFVLSDSDRTCKKYVLQPHLEVFAGQVRNDNSEITASDEVKVAAVSLVQALDVIQSRKEVNRSARLRGISPMH